jgi:membrane protein YdbS with pleckstrin-like domain
MHGDDRQKGLAKMQCDACGREVPASSAFCPHCGTPLAGRDDDSGNDQREAAVAQITAHGGGRGSSGDPAPEEELWSGTYSPKAMVGWGIGAAALTVLGVVVVAMAGGSGAAWFWLVIGALLVWAALGLVVLYRRMTVRYQLTTYRLFHEKGLLSRTRDRIEVIDIDDVTLTQGLIERMLNVGTIYILSSDVSHANLQMPGIEDARRVSDLIDNTRRAERQRRGLFMENV